MVFILSALWWRRIRGLWKLPDGRDWLRGKLGLVPQSNISSDGSVLALMATSSKRAYATPRSAAPRAPAPVTGHCWPIPLQETLKGRSGSVSVGSPGMHMVLFDPLEYLWQIWGLILNAISPSYHLGLLLCPWTWGIFFWWDPTFSCQWLFSSEL